jgi:deoxyribodipyrimidine photo-lyase
LEAFSAQWKELGGGLVLRSGGSLHELRALVRKTGAGRVYWNRRYEAPLRKVDAEVKRALRDDGVEAGSFNSSLLDEPHTVSTGQDRPYKVYTPYWKAVKDRRLPAPDDPDLKALRFPGTMPRSDSLASLGLLPEVKWYKEMDRSWTPGEEGARERLDAFLKGPVEDYDGDRNRPDLDGTSRLSPYLHWGHIGPREVAARLREKHDLRAKGPQVFLKEIYWREFAHHVLYHFPDTPDSPLRPEFADFPWRRDEKAVELWQKGMTGYPIVDAGMRQLWRTGWMHNRVRMIAASLLVKHLLQDWKTGAKWFWDTLVDADLANNTLGWQWSGGCGADAAPYFRGFNPIIQGKKFDPDVGFVREYIPELAGLPAEHIHAPWDAPAEVLESAGVKLGETYPEPLIEHREGRERALKAFEKFNG